jgi:hypothetical protein
VVEEDLKTLGVEDWRGKIQNSDRWQSVVQTNVSTGRNTPVTFILTKYKTDPMYSSRYLHMVKFSRSKTELGKKMKDGC